MSMVVNRGHMGRKDNKSNSVLSDDYAAGLIYELLMLKFRETTSILSDH